MSRKSSKEPTGFGARVRELRRRKGITQVELARWLGVQKRRLIDYNDLPLKEEPKAIRPLQQRLKVIPKLPPEGQKYLVETIDMLAEKHGLAPSAEQ